MKIFRTLLFYYGLIATTTLLLTSYFLLPKPQNIASALILIPVSFFFWVYATDPSSVSTLNWSKRLLIVIVIVTGLGIFANSVSTRYLPKTGSTTDTNMDEIKQSLEQSNADEQTYRNQLEAQISELKAKIDSLGNMSSAVLGTIASTAPPESSPLPATASGQITVKDANLTTVAIYETSSQDSKVMGTAAYGVVYPFYEKTTDWYKIDPGWVEARWFTLVGP